MNEKIKVLVAEDIDILRENLVETLSLENDIVVVGESDSGKGIVSLSKNTNADIILMDVEMETGNAGIIAANEIFKFNKEIKIIFLTVHEDDTTVLEAMGTGAVDYIVKAVECKKVVQHIRKAYKNKIELESTIQKIMNDEFVRMMHSKQNNIAFIKKIMLLTPSECQIIALLLQDMSVSEVAKSRFVETVTIKKQIGQLLKKFEARRTKEITELIKQLKIDDLFTGENDE